jgi:short-subunit dehydrogenase
MELNQKIILITGASSGIGKDTAIAMAERGARVILCARSEDKLQQVAATIQQTGGFALPVPLDVTRRAAVEDAVNTVLARFGRIDVLVNNAGIGYFGTLVDMPLEAMEKVMAVNFWGVIHCTQAVLPAMIQQKSGQIINVASVAGKRGIPGLAIYCASKFALVGLTESLRAEVADYGIQVILICPTSTDTPFFENAGSDGKIPNKSRGLGMMSSKAVAEAIVEASIKGKREVVLSTSAKALLAMNTLFPSLVDWGMRKVLQRR